MKKRADIMNSYNFKTLHYKNSIGTDFTVGLAKNYRFEGGSEDTPAGVTFLANIPTEEIYTAPDRLVAEGKVVASMPLVSRGNIIDKFGFEFRNGEVVDYWAEKGKEHLDGLFATGENTKRLGEVALVPYHSPISEMKTLFYETLFDENAACHLAFGESFVTCVKGGENIKEDKDRLDAGINVCDIHTDFMIGTSDMQIVGETYDGKKVLVFENGDFAF
jgi:aminopeptidase